MKRIVCKIWSLLIVLAMCVTIMPLNAMAVEADAGTVVATFDQVSALVGETAEVKLTLKNNPGLTSFRLAVSWDQDFLSLEGIEYNAGLGGTSVPPASSTSPAVIQWFHGTENVVLNGVFATLKFRVAEDAPENAVATITADFDPDDICRSDEQNVPLVIENGSVKAVVGIPGDINMDTKVNNKDLVRLAQYLAHWNVEVNEIALDVNGDTKVNNKDLVRLAQYLAKWDVEIHCGQIVTQKCEHSLKTVVEKAASCEEEGNKAYWQCTVCKKYFADALASKEITLQDTILAPTGHSPVVIPAVEPTYTSSGSTEGSVCDVCGKVLVAPTIIPMLTRKQYSIKYNVAGNDSYLMGLSIENPNPSTYNEGEGVVLQELRVDGYIFEGWYNEKGEKVTRITDTDTGNVELTANWKRDGFSVQFNVSMIDPSQRDLLVINKDAEGVNKNVYTSDKAWVLPTLTMDTYTFVGWSDQNGNFYTDNIIPKGTTGDLILKDCWVSQRNRAVAKTKLDDPLVVEDTENQMIYFCYEIGTIENVPLYTTQELNCVNGIITIVEKTTSHVISKEEMQTLGSTITKETTDSTQVTLSSEYSDITEVSENYLSQTGKDRTTAETEAVSQSKTQSFNATSGGSSQTYQYNDLTSKNTTNQSYVLNTNLETGLSTELNTGIKNTTEASAGISFPVDIIKVNAGVKNTTEVSASANLKTHMDASIGTTSTWDNQTYNEQNHKNSQTDVKTWNASSSATSAYNASKSETVSEALHEMVSNSYGYGKTYSSTYGNSELRGVTSSTGETTDSSVAFTYTEQQIQSETVGLQTTGNTYGNYRMIMAGTLHTFAVVGYDIANKEYFVYTYNVMGDGSQNDGWHEIMDYSYDRSFKDFENTVIPFSVPKYVEDYVNSRIVYTEGLEYDFDNRNHTAVVEAYTGTDTVVYVPSFMVDEEGNAYRVTGFTEEAFSGKDIAAISLGKFISNIPDRAFKGCSSLEYIVCPGVISIGAEAFSGCTSLKEFNISEGIRELGQDAFVDVPAVTAEVGYNEDYPEEAYRIAENAAACGAKSITLDLSNLPENSPLNFVVRAGDKLVLKANGKTFTNTTLESHTVATELNRISFAVNARIPLKLYSNDVTLYSVDVNTDSAFAVILANERTNLRLSGTNSIGSGGDSAILCKNVSVSYSNSGKLKVTADILSCGTIDDPNNRISFVNRGEVKYIDENMFDMYEAGIIHIILNVNSEDGVVEETNLTAYFGLPIGELPEASRDYYDFLGWFTQSDGGEQITAESVFDTTEDRTLYAHWQLHNVSDWVSATEAPADAQIVNRKWTYSERIYTESGNSNEPGWTQYNVQQTGWGGTQGPVYNDPSNGARNVWSEQYVTSSNYRTLYRYFRYSTDEYGKTSSDMPTSAYGRNYYSYVLDYELTETSAMGNYSQGYKYRYNGVNYFTVWKDDPFTTQEWVSDNYGTRWYFQDPVYTYYYYRDENRESENYPGSGEVSNIVEWVQYRAK